MSEQKGPMSPVEAMRDLAAAVCQRRSQRYWGNSRDDAISEALQEAAAEIRALPMDWQPIPKEQRGAFAPTAEECRDWWRWNNEEQRWVISLPG